MAIPQRAVDLEIRSIGTDGEQTLAGAHKILKDEWRNGNRERELALHLLFLSWYGLVEPGHLTGFSESDELRGELNRTLTEVHDYFEPEVYQDAVCCRFSSALVLVHVRRPFHLGEARHRISPD